MKKTLGLILVFAIALCSVFSFASCKKETESAIYGLAAAASPSKTVTLTDFTTKDGKIYEGEFIMTVEGNNSIFDFKYERPKTIEESAEDGIPELTKTVEGTIYFKDGKFSEDGDKWTSEAPSATAFKFDLKPEYLTGATINGADTELTAELTPENAIKVLGTDLQPNGNVKLTVKTNGVNLSRVIIEYTTTDGSAVRIDTTYTYNSVTLVFPESAE